MNATTGVLLLGGAAALGVGVAMAQQKVAAEKTPTQTGLPKGTTFTPGEIPAHTTNPDAEAQMATWRQLLIAYKSDIANLQSQQASLNYEIAELEGRIGAACEGYALGVTWHCSQDFTDWRCTWFDRRTDQTALALCKTAVVDGATPAPRAIPCAESKGLFGNHWCDASKALDILNSDIEKARKRVGDLARDLQQKKAKAARLDTQIGDLQKRINDLNARGVY